MKVITERLVVILTLKNIIEWIHCAITQYYYNNKRKEEKQNNYTSIVAQEKLACNIYTEGGILLIHASRQSKLHQERVDQKNIIISDDSCRRMVYDM